MLKQCSLGLDIQIRFASALLMETGTWGIASEKSVLDLERQSAHPAGHPHEILVAGHGSVGQHHRRRGVAVFILEPPSQTPRIDAISDRSSAASHNRSPYSAFRSVMTERSRKVPAMRSPRASNCSVMMRPKPHAKSVRNSLLSVAISTTTNGWTTRQ